MTTIDLENDKGHCVQMADELSELLANMETLGTRATREVTNYQNDTVIYKEGKSV